MRLLLWLNCLVSGGSSNGNGLADKKVSSVFLLLLLICNDLQSQYGRLNNVVAQALKVSLNVTLDLLYFHDLLHVCSYVRLPSLECTFTVR